MKNLLLRSCIVSVLLCFYSLSISQDFCGTESFRIKERPRLLNARSAGPYAFLPEGQPCKRATIRVAFHVIRDANGQGGFNNGTTISDDILSELNNTYNQHNIFFVYKNEQNKIEYIDNAHLFSKASNNYAPDGAYTYSDGKFDDLKVYSNEDAIDIFLLGNGLNGTNRAADIGSTSLILTGSTSATTVSPYILSHEMGHCLGLYHTFHGTACDERPIGSHIEYVGVGVGEVTGDYVEDTPPDPTKNHTGSMDPNCINERELNPVYVQCGNVSGNVDPGGAPWLPLINNYMDYLTTSNFQCTIKFTTGQVQRMMKVIATDEVVNKVVVKTQEPINITTSGSFSQCSTNLTPVTLQANNGDNAYDFSWVYNSTSASYIVTPPAQTTTYTVSATSNCFLPNSASVTVHVNDDVNINIEGPASICEGAMSTQFTINNNGNTNYSGGAWSTNAGTISSSGELNISGITASSVTITYTVLTSSSNCTVEFSKTIPVVLQSAAVNIVARDESGTVISEINNNVPMCIGKTITLTAESPDGLSYEWSTGATTKAITVAPSTTTSYIVIVTSPCGNQFSSSKTITVNSLPVITNTVAITNPICKGQNVPFEFTPSGGSYYHSQNANSVSGGIYDAQVAGNDYVLYTVQGANNCINSLGVNIVVYPTVLTINGNSEMCAETSQTLIANIPGGLWTSSNTARAVVDPVTGVVTALQSSTVPVTVSITYRPDVCDAQPLSKTITINPKPKMVKTKSIIKDCETFDFAANMVGGTWVSSDPSIASIDNSGHVTTTSGQTGVVQITYNPPTTSCASSDFLRFQLTVVPCSPTDCGKETAVSIAAGTVTDESFYNNNFVIDGDIDIVGTVVFNNAQVRVTKNAKINVTANSKLIINGSHFYACEEMWQGIKVVADNAIIEIDKTNSQSSFIEDAETALSYEPETPIQTLTANTKLISVKNTIFNRNNKSIEINYLVDALGTSNESMPVSIENCLFTSRNIYFDPSIIAWDNVNQIKVLKDAYVTSTPFLKHPEIYTAPYINETDYPAAFLKDGLNMNKPQAGIIIKYSSTAVNNVYKAFVIGAAPSNQDYYPTITNTNIFDNIDTGITVMNANIKLMNAVFQNPAKDGSVGFFSGFRPLLGRGAPQNIFVLGGQSIIHHPHLFNPDVQNAITTSTDISTPAGNYNNAFFGMSQAVNIQGLDVNVSGCFIATDQNVYNLSEKGKIGIRTSSPIISRTVINNNKIYNVRDAITFGIGGEFITYPSTDPVIAKGLVKQIDNNIISNQISPSNPFSAGLVNHAITSTAYFYSSGATEFSLKNNTINATNGIQLGGWLGATLKNNAVNILEDNTGTFSEQYGLYLYGAPSLTATGKTLIEDNTISGYGNYANVTAVNVAQLSLSEIGCNTVSNAMHGFKFTGTNPNTKFWDNVINPTNLYGFTLENQGIIGMQGNWDGNLGAICPSNNNWVEDATIWNSYNSYMTNCDNSDASQSPLVVLNSVSNPWLNPNGSGFSNIMIPYQHTGTSTSPLIYASTNDPSCERCANAVYAERSAEDLTILEQIADGTVLLLNDRPEERLLVMQEQLYKLLHANTYLLANSTSLQQFVYDNQWSNLDFIHYAGQMLAEQNMPALETLLGFWPGQEGLDETYYQYFEWMVSKYHNPEWQPDEATVLEYANRCPLTHGTIVYAIRNFYNAITGRINEFENNCNPPAARGGNNNKPAFIRLKEPKQKIEDKKSNQTEKDKLLIYPNPGKDIVTVKFPNIKEVNIFDLQGRIVKKVSVNNISSTQINISGLHKGVYLVKVIGSENKIIAEKLIVQ